MKSSNGWQTENRVLKQEIFRLRNEVKRLQEGVCLAYAHCYENEMDYTLDALRMLFERDEKEWVDWFTHESIKGKKLLLEHLEEDILMLKH